MFSHLLKTIPNAEPFHPNPNPNPALRNQQAHKWAEELANNQRPRGGGLQGGVDKAALGAKMRALGVHIEELESSSEKVGVELNGSAQASEKVSEVLSANDFEREECHPMILSNINNVNSNIDRIFVMRIRNATSDLRQTIIDLVDCIQQQKAVFQDQKQRLLQQFQKLARTLLQRPSNDSNHPSRQSLEKQILGKTMECQKLGRQLQQCRAQLEQQKGKGPRLNSKPSFEEKVCANCKSLQAENKRVSDQFKQLEQQYESLLIQNDHLQEHIFDIEQRIVGVDLQVERRLKEKLKSDKKIISPIKEDSKEVIDQLQSEIAVLQEKCRRFENQSIQQSSLREMRERERRLREMELELQDKESNFKNHFDRLESMKEANYQREHEILVAEENLSKKIADFRKKEAELSEWEAELTRKSRELRGRGDNRDNTLANQFPSNEMSLQNSNEDLNRSGQMSLKSFGKNNAILDHRLKGSPSQEQLDYGATYKIKTLDNYDDGNYIKRPHEFIHQRQNYPLRTREERPPQPIKLEPKRYGDSSYVPKPRDHPIEIINKKYNPQLSGYKDSREASPYRNINEPARGRPLHAPKGSSNNYRQLSKNSRSSTSKSKLAGMGQLGQFSARGLPRDAQVGGLGSKLQRLREEIKKQIESIK